MNLPKIICKRIGYSNVTLLINGADSVLIDTGVRGNLQRIKILFRQFNLTPSDIKLIVLTHTHHDHTGNLRRLKELTGAKVMVHKNEFENLKAGVMPIPKGIGIYPGFITAVARWFFPKFVSPEPVVADLINENEFDLGIFGIDGKVISTPGHTSGSQSVLLGDRLIAGDTFVNMPNGMIFPPFANEPDVLLNTWQNIFNRGVKTIYPGHGKPFSTEKALVGFERWKRKIKN
jgi:glyoxylase-like metal-dependent hydrolase (beta-lactamase superfamily II)